MKRVLILSLMMFFLNVSVVGAASATSSNTIVYETGGTYTVEATTSGSKYLYYGASEDKTKAIINIGSGTGTYSFTSSNNSGNGVMMLDRYNEVEVNGNIDYTQTNSSSVQTWGIDVYSSANLTFNGNLDLNLKGTMSDSRYMELVSGLVAEASSLINMNGKVNINSLEAVNSVKLAQAIAIAAYTIDGDVQAGNEGKSVININSSDTTTLKNIKATSSGDATAYAISSSGEGYNSCVLSEVNVNSPLVIDNVSASGETDEAAGIVGSVLGVVNVNKNLEISNISSATNTAYALFANWGGTVNVNASKDATVKITGDVSANSCFSSDEDASYVNLNLTDSTSYLEGAIMRTRDDEDDEYGNTGLTLSNGATWKVLNSSNPSFTSNQVTDMTLDNGIIDMSDTGSQVINIDNLNNGVGTIIMDASDQLNITNAAGTNKLNIKLVVESEDELNALVDNMVFSTTSTDNIEYTFSEIVLGSYVYKLDANYVLNETTGLYEWKFVLTKEEEKTETTTTTEIITTTAISTDGHDTQNPETFDKVISCISCLIIAGMTFLSSTYVIKRIGL